MPRKKNRTYFDKDTELAICEYNETTDRTRRDRLFALKIYPALDKLVENVIHKYKFYYYESSYEDLKHETVVYLHERLSKFSQEKGKAFSYFTRVAINFLIQQNASVYAHIKSRDDVSLIDETRDIAGEISFERNREMMEDFVALWAEWCDDRVDELFESRRDQKVANAVFTLFKNCREVDNFNKKALYILIREQTDVKTAYITKVVADLKRLFIDMYEDYLESELSLWDQYLLKRRD
jgi:DNA-directed RNA polymerase specialized sigma subunit